MGQRNIFTWLNSAAYFFFQIFHLSLAATSFVKCSPVFLFTKSTIPKDIIKSLHPRPTTCSASWIPYQWQDRESVHLDVQRSKHTLSSWWIKLLRIYNLDHQQIWYEHHSTQKDLSFLLMHSTRVELLVPLFWIYPLTKLKVITHKTPSHAIDYLCQIWKESIQNSRSYTSRYNKMYDILAVFVSNLCLKFLKTWHTISNQLSLVPVTALFRTALLYMAIYAIS